MDRPISLLEMAEETIYGLEDTSDVKKGVKLLKREETEPSGTIANWLTKVQLESQKEKRKKIEQNKNWRNNDQSFFKCSENSKIDPKKFFKPQAWKRKEGRKEAGEGGGKYATHHGQTAEH